MVKKNFANIGTYEDRNLVVSHSVYAVTEKYNLQIESIFSYEYIIS